MLQELHLISKDIQQYSLEKGYPFTLFPSIHLHYTYKNIILSPRILNMLYNKKKSTKTKYIFDVKHIGIPIYCKILYNTNYSSTYETYIQKIRSTLPFYKDISNMIIEYLPISPTWKLQKKITYTQAIPYSLYNILLYEIPVKDLHTCSIPKYYRKALYGIFPKKSCISSVQSKKPICIENYDPHDILVMIFFTNISFSCNEIMYSSSTDDESELEYI